METQVELFHERIEDAIATDIKALGGPKKVAGWLTPAKGESGADWIRACLMPDRREKFSPDELLLIKRRAREIGSFATVTYEAQQLGYRVEWIDPQDEADELRRDVRDLLKVVNQRLERIERVEARPVLVRK